MSTNRETIAALVSIERLSHVLLRIYEERRRVVRFLLSRILWRTGLGERLGLKIRLREGVTLGFSRSALAAMLWLDEDYAYMDRSIIRALVPRGGAMVDVGANIGLLSLVAGRAVGPAGKVLAIEPHSVTFTSLSANVERAEMPWLQSVAAAAGECSATVGITSFREDDQNRVSHDGTGTPVTVVTLDELTKNLGHVDVLKIDVEGYEEAVLRGAKATLGKTQHVLIECSTTLAAHHDFHPETTLALLTDAGFSLHEIEGMRPVVRPWTDATARNILATRSPEQARERMAQLVGRREDGWAARDK